MQYRDYYDAAELTKNHLVSISFQFLQLYLADY